MMVSSSRSRKYAAIIAWLLGVYVTIYDTWHIGFLRMIKAAVVGKTIGDDNESRRVQTMRRIPELNC